MLFYGRTVIPICFFVSKSRNSKVFPHSDFKMALGFIIKGNIAVTTLRFKNMDVWKINTP